MKRHHEQAEKFAAWATAQGWSTHIRCADTGTAYVTVEREWVVRFGDHDEIYAGSLASVSPNASSLAEAKREIKRVCTDTAYAALQRREIKADEATASREYVEGMREHATDRLHVEGGLDSVRAKLAELEARLAIPHHRGGPSGDTRKGLQGRARDLRNVIAFASSNEDRDER